jgi:hypothetical protein
MGCNCNAPIDSWIDWQNAEPKDPMDPVANTWSYPGTPAPSVTALETDNLQMVADAAQWNFQHLMLNAATNPALSLAKVIFLRGGMQWQNSIQITMGGATKAGGSLIVTL